MMTIEFDILFSSNNLIATVGTDSVKNYLEIFFPKGLIFNPPTLTFYKDNIEGYYNFFIVEKNAIFLPNWLSEIIQISANQNIDTTLLRTIQEWTFGLLNKFRILCEIRAALWWWLMFNPYQQPFNTLRILTEWYLTSLTGIFPIIMGIDIGPTIAITALGVLLDLLNRLVFTMPYLPSEGEKFTINNFDQLDNPALADLIDKIGEDITVFRYLPSLWYKYQIPDDLREYWYNKKPEILQYFLKNYENLGIDFLPNQILRSEYENHIEHNTLLTSLLSLGHISITLTSSIDHVVEISTKALFSCHEVF